MDKNLPDSSGWCATHYNDAVSCVYSESNTAPVLGLLGAKPGEHIIDFGCGSGEVSLRIAKAVGEHGVVVGVDQSESMIKAAKTNGLSHAFVSDIQELKFPEGEEALKKIQFDAVFSSACLHWCKRDPRGVLESAKSVLKPGGRFVCEMGGFSNCVGVRGVLHTVLRQRGYDPVALDPWYFPSVEEYRQLLRSAGFIPLHISLNPRLTPISSGLAKWLQVFVRRSFLQDMGDAEAEEIIQETVQRCEVDCKDADGVWHVMYMRLRFYAVLPESKA